MAVLMLFNDADSLAYEDIEAATAIPEDDLKRVLQSLACVKVRACGRAALPAARWARYPGWSAPRQLGRLGTVPCLAACIVPPFSALCRSAVSRAAAMRWSPRAN